MQLQPGGAQYGVPLPEIPGREAEAASPISGRPPAGDPRANFEELGPALSGNSPDDQVLATGEEAERGGGGVTGNRWPLQETLTLLKIRSEMDAAFRDATLKAPLWEEVSRKLAELGYKRTAKKCKEKFENVHKYYKRTKEGRAGRQDAKGYRFFSQLEALHSGSSAAAVTPAAPVPSTLVATSSAFSASLVGPPPSGAQPLSVLAPPTLAMPTRVVVPELTPLGGAQRISSSAAVAGSAAAAGIGFSSNSSSSEWSESDDEETAGESQEGRKRKSNGGGSGPSRKMMPFFHRLMKQVMERQEAMQQRFLDVMEKREQDRMIRDEAWRRQEKTRLNREQELLEQERAMASSRDTAIISYLQKLTGRTIPMPTMSAVPLSISPFPQQQSHTPPPQPAAPQLPLPQQQQRPPAPFQSPSQQHVVQHHHHRTDMARYQPSSAMELVPSSEPMSSSSRWPKAEVHALIKLRSELESKYQETGPKGPLWEEISSGMQQLGYKRSAKRCKEKWENINKYFKKVKESNKKRPEDSKTCSYFHQLDALYRNKLLGTGNTMGSPASNQRQSDTPRNVSQQQAPPPPPPPPPQPAAEPESKNATRTQTTNGSLHMIFSDQGLEKVRTVINDYDKLDQTDSDNMNQDDDDDEGKSHYKIQFQRQSISAGSGGNPSTAASATASSFLAIAR
ncbi:hypothetical protein C4D60_Mb04t36020 [Musa balbisiana]|uniref:Myb-like domain-containing protein n=1 Tax=Musa balbisiana TaxID=52838 RepID=A0A4S8KHP9_MUSBA|nr:hypothetical protein C4D60_Mb04t36020 [Musa balbisiana]